MFKNGYQWCMIKISRLTGQIREKFDRNEFRSITLQAVPFWIASVVTGLVAVAYAKLFFWVEDLSIHTVQQIHWSIFILSPVFFILSWWTVKQFAPTAQGSGIPQLMAAIELATPRKNERVNKLLSLRIGIVKILSSIFLLMGGGAIGREGPTIQVAGSIFRFINNSLPSFWPKVSKKIMLMTGGAAGLAAAFNTPLGGIVFVVEELTRTHIAYFRTAVFTAVILAGMTAQWLLGPYLYLGYPKVSIVGFSFILYVLLASALAGLGGAWMAEIMLKIIRWKKTLTKTSSYLLFITVFALLFATMVYYAGTEAMGSGKEVMGRLLFSNNKAIEWYLFPVRFLGPILSFTIGGAGGVFATSLSAGSALGAGVASLLHLSLENYNLIILVSMVGFLTGVTRTPFTASILVLEMTDRHSAIFHLMLAGMCAYLVSYLVNKRSFYDHLKEGYLEEAGAGDQGPEKN